MGNSPRQWVASYAPTLRREKVGSAVKMMGTSLPRPHVASASDHLGMYLKEEEDNEFEEEEYEEEEGGGGFVFDDYEGAEHDDFGEDGESSSEGGGGGENEDEENVGVSSSKRILGEGGRVGEKDEGRENVGAALLGSEEEEDVVQCKLKRRLIASLMLKDASDVDSE